MKKTISVVMPVYNASKYLKKTIESVLGQTFKDIELICVNDGSTDDSLAILRSFEEKDNRMIVIDQKNTNAGAARNRGFSKVSSKYVIFLDADDLIEKNMLEKMYGCAEEVSADIVVTDSDIYLDDIGQYREGHAFKKNMLPSKKVFAGNDVNRIFSVFIGWPWDKLFLTDFIRENKLEFQEQKSTNDLFFVYAALVRARRISVIPDILIHHRMNNKASISMNREKSWDCSHAALIKLKRQLIIWNMFDSKMEKDYSNYALNHSIWQITSLGYPAQKKYYESFREKWAEEYGLLKRKPDYFYDADEKKLLDTIIMSDFETFLASDNARKKEIIQKLENGIFDCENRIVNLELEVESLKSGINEIKKSKAYKTGMAITSVPRKIKSLIK